MNSWEDVVAYVLNVAGITGLYLLVLGGPAFATIYLTSRLSAYVQHLAAKAMGFSLYLLLFGWLGTTVHEMGHALVAILFGHRVVSFRLILNAKTGELGRVETIHNRDNIISYIGLFFIGIAPVVFGTLVIFLSLYVLFGGQMYLLMDRMVFKSNTIDGTISDGFSSALAFFAFVFSPQHLVDWRLYLFLYITFAVGSSIHLSDSDIRGAREGCVIFIVLMFLFNLLVFAGGVISESRFDWLIACYTVLYIFYIILFFVVLLDLLAIAILWLPASIRD